MNKIELNKSLYSRESIEVSKRDFSEFCDVMVTENERFYQITLVPKKKDETEDWGRLFANFCLGNMK
jgi:predicted esterase YcpF (UPF0227 family)